ncbi:hypothetical protein ACF0H5_005719 [Mactra antiquata]
MKITVKENRKSNVGNSAFSEFTDTEIKSLFPASELLSKINFDHVYSSGGVSQLRLQYKPKTSKSVPSANKNGTRCDQNFENGKLNQSLSDTKADDYDVDNSDDSLTDESNMSLNADAIQEVFQRMIDLTSLDTITDQPLPRTAGNDDEKQKTTPLKKVMFVDELPGFSKSTPAKVNVSSASTDKESEVLSQSTSFKSSPSNSSTTKKPDNMTTSKPVNVAGKKTSNQMKPKNKTSKIVKKTNKIVNSMQSIKHEFSKNQCSANDQTLVAKYAELEHEMNSLYRNLTEVLIRRWGEYLSMTTDKIRTFEIENAKQQKMVEDVVEMLENKDLYVWQLIEDLQFFDAM